MQDKIFHVPESCKIDIFRFRKFIEEAVCVAFLSVTLYDLGIKHIILIYYTLYSHVEVEKMFSNVLVIVNNCL